MAQGGHFPIGGTRRPPRREAQQPEGGGSALTEDHVHLRYHRPFQLLRPLALLSHTGIQIQPCVPRCWGSKVNERQGLAAGAPVLGVGRWS